MKKYLLIISFFYSLSCSGKTIDNDSLYNNRKNSISFQLLGNTPYFGIIYARDIYVNKNSNIELGLGTGFIPFSSQISSSTQTFPLNFTHSATYIYKKYRMFAPTVGYSGIAVSGLSNTNGKAWNYIPSINLGIRADFFNNWCMNLSVYSYFYTTNQYLYRPQSNTRINYRRVDPLFFPSLNFQKLF